MRSFVSRAMLGAVLSSSIGCVTSSFKIIGHENSAYEFQASSDRIIHECEKVEKDDGGFIYGYMLHILDEQKRPITLVQTNSLDKESCDDRLRKIGKILSQGRVIYLAGIGDFDKPDKLDPHKYIFPSWGSFPDSGYSFQFIAIKNESDQCYAAFTGTSAKCPPLPFPLGKK